MNRTVTQVLWALAKILIVTLTASGVTYPKSFVPDKGQGPLIGNPPSLQPEPNNLLYSTTQAAALSPGSWQAVTPNSGSIVARHESAFVESGGKFYLLGGRGSRPVQMYDPLTKAWTNKATPPLEINHIQAIAYNGLIYVINAFTGVYPHETPVPNMYIYNPGTNTWSVGPTIPAARRRGSSGVVVYNNKFYIFCGIIDGHWSGWVPWTDEYDPATNTWKILPDAPRARDHSQSALVGNKVYLAGGRRSSGITNQVFNITVPEVDAFDLVTKQWSTLPHNIPTQRAGVSVAVLGQEVVVIGGESVSQGTAHAEAEALDVNTQTWRSLAKLLQGRHGTQPIVYTNKIFIAAGSANRGGGPELNTMEVYQAGSAVNQAPVVSNPIPNQSTTVGTAYSFTFAANTFTDPDGNALTYSASLSSNAALPAWLTFNAGTRTFSGTPPSGSATPLSIKVTASDGQLQTNTTFSLTVNPATTGQRVVSFTLINADTDLDLQTLSNGASLNLATLPTKNLNIRANTNPAKVGSVVFNLSGKQTRNQTEGGAPYALFGDVSGNYNVWVPAVGSYTLKATPFSSGGGGGTTGTALTINFTVINQAGARMAVSENPAIGTVLLAYPNPLTDGRFKVSLSEAYQGEISYVLVYSTGAKLAGGTLTVPEPTSELSFDFSGQMRSAGGYYLRLEGKKLKGFLKLQRQ